MTCDGSVPGNRNCCRAVSDNVFHHWLDTLGANYRTNNRSNEPYSPYNYGCIPYGCIPLVKIQFWISNPKMDFLFLWVNPKKDFESIEPTPRKDLIDSIQINLDFLDLISKHFIGDGFEKSTHGQQGFANKIVPSLLSLVHNSVTSHVFVVINPFKIF